MTDSSLYYQMREKVKGDHQRDVFTCSVLCDVLINNWVKPFVSDF